jgi:hypothetical protein
MPPRSPTVRVAVPAPPLAIALPRSFLVLTETRGLSGHDILEDFIDVSLGEILNPTSPYKRNDVTLDATSVGDDR